MAKGGICRFCCKKSDLKQQNRPLRTDFGLIFLKRACLKKPVFLENLLVHVCTRLFFVSTRLLFIRTSFSLAGALFGCFSAQALIVHQVIQFLLPSHIALPRFVVRQIPLPLKFDVLCSLGCCLVGRKVFKILLDRLLGDIPVLIEYIKIFVTEVTQFVFGVPFFQILEPVDGAALLENIVGADEDDVLFLEVTVGFALVQGF